MKKNNPIISVIIPAYNSAATLERAVFSIGNNPDIEILIIENGSSDNTVEIISKLLSNDSRIAMFTSPKGVSIARNIGLDNAKGQYVFFLDADDFFEDNAIEKMIEYSKKDYDLICFGHYNKNIEKKQSQKDVFSLDQSIDIKCKMLSSPFTYMACWSKLFSKKIIDSYGIRFNESLVVAEDGDFVINYLQYANSIILSHHSLYHYSISSESTMNRYDPYIIKKYIKALCFSKLSIKEQSPLINQAFGKYILQHLNLMMVRGPFSTGCSIGIRKKIYILKKTCSIKIIQEALNEVCIKDISDLRMIPLFLLKHRLYLVTGGIYALRGIRNKLRTISFSNHRNKGMSLNPLSLNQIKHIELDILLSFDELCKKNNLYYTLCGGTLLGAVRHKGFIPWDDDIDVLMPRPDYERLLNGEDIDFSCLPENIKIASWKNRKTIFPFIKLLDTRTIIDSKYINDKCSNNLWIDVFPIDGNPTKKGELHRLYNTSLLLRSILKIKMARMGEGKNIIKKVIKPVFKVLYFPIPIYLLDYIIDRNAQKYRFRDSRYVGGVVWGYGAQEAIEKKAYLSPKSMMFEEHDFNVPSNYHEYLTNLYGDYMQVPPEDKRITHNMKAYIRND